MFRLGYGCHKPLPSFCNAFRLVSCSPPGSAGPQLAIDRTEKSSSRSAKRRQATGQEPWKQDRKKEKKAKTFPEWKDNTLKDIGRREATGLGKKEYERREKKVADQVREEREVEAEWTRSREKIKHSSRGKKLFSKQTKCSGTGKEMKSGRAAMTPLVGEPRGKVKKEFKIREIDARGMILYEDDDLLVLNKPSGLAVHNGPKMDVSLADFLPFWEIKGEVPQLAHRLDKDTSGVIILTRHREAARMMADLFRERKVLKKYWAITVGVPSDLRGSLEGFISLRDVSVAGGQRSMNRMVLVDSGRGTEAAHTRYQVLAVPQAAPQKCSLMQLQPITGLKHQLRVHLAEGLHCPAVGDYKFGGRLLRMDVKLTKKLKSMDLERGHLYLHAKEISIPGYHGDEKPPLTLEAPLPSHFEMAVVKLELRQ